MKHMYSSREYGSIQSLGLKKRKIRTPFYALVIHGILFIVILFLFDMSQNNQVLLLENGVWTELARLPDSVEKIEINKEGILWAQLKGSSGFSRYENDKWTSVQLTDFTSKSDDLINFTVTESGLWAVTEKNILFFDGGKWQAYSGIKDDYEGAAIAASANQVWVVGQRGIHYFNGSNWEILKDEHNDFTRVRLFSDNSGDLFLAGRGVWRRNNSEWEQIVAEDVLVRPYFIAVIGDHLWVIEKHVPKDKWTRKEGKKIAKVSLKDKKITSYLITDLGLSEDATIGAMVKNNEVLIYSSDKIIVYRDEKWQDYNMPLPPLPATFYKLVELKPYGENSFVALAQVNFGLLSILADNLIIILLTFMLIMFGIVHWIAKTDRKWREEDLAIIRQSTGIVAVGDALIVDGQKIDGDKRNKLTLGKRLLSYVFLIVLYILIQLLGKAVVHKLEDVADYSVILAVIGFGLFLAAIVVCGTLFLVAPMYYILRPLNRGDYQSAIDRAILMHKKGRYVADELHGTILMYYGKLSEAEQVFRRYLAERATTGHFMLSGVICTLVAAYARTLLWNGNLKGAERENNKAIEIYNKGHEAYVGLAETYLCGTGPDLQALALIEKAIKLQKLDRLFLPYQWLRIYSAHAWALARLQRFDEAEKSLNLAFRKGGRKLVPEVALVHLRASIVYGLQGKKDLSIDQLQKAYEVDPNGFVGQKARDAMPKQAADKFDYGI